MCYMTTVTGVDDVGVRELRQNLSVYLRRIAQGETLRVTEHGHPVALLTPIPNSGDPVLDDLEAQGLLERPKVRRRPLPRPVPLEPGEPTLSEVLQQMRDEDDR
jgi:prevent-host-death family protein